MLSSFKDSIRLPSMQNTALHARALLEGTPGLYWAIIELIYINLELYYHDIDVQLLD